MTSLRPHFFRNVANILLLGFLLAAVCEIFGLPTGQGDVIATHYAVQAWHAGLNPYDPAAVSSMAGYTIDLAYIYPPDTLPFFVPFHVFESVDVSRAIYLAWQLGLLAALLVCWRRFFLDAEDRANPVLFAFCLLGLNSTVLVDLRVGNISLLEQNLLWLGLVAWLRGRYGVFSILLWLAASCKLTLLAFSVLLLLPPARQPGKFLLVWAALAARLALDAVCSPRLFGQFIHALTGGFGGAHEWGRNNPCVLQFFKEIVQNTDRTMTSGDVLATALPLYVVIVAVVLTLSWLAWREICRRFPEGGEGRGIRLICLTCLAYGLTSPRMKDYSYVVLLLPVWLTLKRATPGRLQTWLVIAFVACLADHAELSIPRTFYALFWLYAPLWTALAAWVFLLHETFAAPPVDVIPARSD